ncbi:MAG TPA: XRE family transcriptional regulator [Mycobacterium sp.]
MTLTADTGNAHQPGNGNGARPVEHWPTTAIRSALETGDISVWQRIVVAIKRDPYGRTARQVEEVLETAPPQGITRALSEVLIRSRQHLEATERAEAARHVRSLVARSGLSQQEFASRIGVPTEDLVLYLDGRVSPPASLVIRIRRLSDRFARTRAQRPEG